MVEKLVLSKVVAVWQNWLLCKDDMWDDDDIHFNNILSVPEYERDNNFMNKHALLYRMLG